MDLNTLCDYREGRTCDMLFFCNVNLQFCIKRENPSFHLANVKSFLSTMAFHFQNRLATSKADGRYVFIKLSNKSKCLLRIGPSTITLAYKYIKIDIRAVASSENPGRGLVVLGWACSNSHILRRCGKGLTYRTVLHIL